MEIFDIVDENGQPTGEIVERTEAHAKGIRHRTAHVWLVKYVCGEPYVLLQKRAACKDSFPGKYDTSSAGHIHAGDEPVESAIRELQEELGVRATKDELEFAGTFDIRYEKTFRGILFKDNEVSYVYMLQKEIDEEECSLQEEEVEMVRWFPLKEVVNRVATKDDAFCVPPDGLKLLNSFLAKR